MTVRKQVTYANAEVRGKLRQWKTTLARQYAGFERAYQSNKSDPAVADFVKRSSGTGRRRAFAKLKAMFGAGAMLEGLRLDGPAPLAAWSLLKPRDAVAVGADPQSGRAQNCVTVNYLLAGALPGPTGTTVGVAEGLWTLEVPDHALGRAVERSGMLPDAIIRDAHHNFMRLRPDQIVPHGGFITDKTFLLRAGNGGFISELIFAEDVSDRDQLSVVFARTWIENGQLFDDQVVLADDGLPGDRLGDSFLLPTPLRHLNVEADGSVKSIAASGWLPDLLAKPMGRMQ